ncbi:cysteine desulfurase DndA [Desulfobacula sp.]|uniref:cysteine desulfurase DndA n=1 Tax=Desulfobacula sp. TaxID=2593537 RepID=UPI0019A0A682|nr:cysteine desulfurase DndA [Bacteroidota bacterium]MBL6995473.1 cysteine desulfurase DndA [Desulfobacula sp.]
MKPIYLDCNATTPIDPEIFKEIQPFLLEEFGNSGSRTHEFGARAKRAVQKAREQVASVVHANQEEVIFTSGATESNNIAILGLRKTGIEQKRKHMITSMLEHKAVLEPCEYLEKEGFEITRLPVTSQGVINLEALQNALRPDTLLVSIMQVNNETGIRQPINLVSEILKDHPAYFHTDAAQGFGKDLETIQNPRIDLISISGHKIYAPKGIGALITRRRGYASLPLEAIFFGGGQERGLRPGTLPVALIVGMGKAAELAGRDIEKRKLACKKIRVEALSALTDLEPKLTGDSSLMMEHVLNFSFTGLDSEALMVGLKDLVAISNGSACTSANYSPSHVLLAMGLSEDQANECIRLSWCYMTPQIDWIEIAERIHKML